MGILANIIGTCGVLALLLAYFQLQRGIYTANHYHYLLLNLWGAVAILFSLFWNWNLPAFLIETAWAVISVHSLYRLKKDVQ